MVLNLKLIKRLIVSFVVCLSLFITLTACQGDSDNYTAITQKLALNKGYEGKDFFTQGTSTATLERCSDGDTVAFILPGDKFVNIRFYGVDTPESTGSVEKWGKAASIFTEQILTKAHSIVLEASTTPAEVDSYGSRYLGFVWYKSTEDSKWLNLNLQLIENGYSKNTLSVKHEYSSYFKEAEAFAKNKPLHIWDANAVDQYYSSEAIETNIGDIIDNLDTYYNEENNSGAKVRIQAYLKSYTISSTGTHTFVAGQIIDGVERTINIYTGYSSATVNNFIRVGHLYTITGNIQVYNGQLQISGIKYVAMQSGGDYLTTVQKEYYLTFNSNVSYNAFYGKSLYESAKITAAEIQGENIVLTATARQKTSGGYAEEAETFTFIIKNTENLTDVSTLVNRKLTGGGLQEKDNEVTVLMYSNIEIK